MSIQPTATDPNHGFEQQRSELTTIEKLRGLPWSIAANVANTLFCQFTFFGSVFPLFLSELGLSKSQMGFLFSLMPFLGVVAPLIGPATARFGYKNTYLIFWGIRKIVTAFLLLTPWVLGAYGLQAAVIFISLITASFALCRAVAETARVPWVQEYVPPTVQGKYTATSNIFTSLAGFLSVLAAGAVLGHTHNLSSFMLLIGIGVFFGFICVWLTSFIPGGAPVPQTKATKPKRDLREALRDHNFLFYLIGVSVIVLATTPVASFLPLFMQEQVGLSAGNVVYLQMGSLLGSLLTSYAWGWAADRYGSKPVMISGINLRAITPLLFLLIPTNSTWSLPVALFVYFLQGAADMGWGVGSTRLLYVSVVPREKKGDYLALYSAWVGIVGGLSQLVGGFVLDAAHGLSGQWLFFTLDAYTPLFVTGVILMFACNLLFRRLRADNQFGLRQFTGIFLRGNPFLAMGSLIRYQFAHDETEAVKATAQLGQARSHITVDELLDALHDPRYNVRFEAVISIARMPPDPRLRAALEEILNGNELALSAVASWALGRMGDRHAIPALRSQLDSPYHSIRAQSVRALGMLSDAESADALLARFSAGSEDRGLQMAYASSLGRLREEKAIAPLLAFLYHMQNKGARLEIGLALARLLGDEHHYIQLVRQMRHDPGTTTAQALLNFQRRLERAHVENPALLAQLSAVQNAFAHNDLIHGVPALCQGLTLLPTSYFTPTGAAILAECNSRLTEFGAERSEYLVLTLHTLAIGWQTA